MDVQAGTGWHVTELVRFAEMGSVEPYRGGAEEVAGVLVCPRVKSGEPLRTSVSTDKSLSTTRRFYTTHAVPAKVPTLR